jgi:hypothetical protein
MARAHSVKFLFPLRLALRALRFSINFLALKVLFPPRVLPEGFP